MIYILQDLTLAIKVLFMTNRPSHRFQIELN